MASLTSLARIAKPSDYFVVVNDLLPKVPHPFPAQVAKNMIWSALHVAERGLLVASTRGKIEAFALVEEIRQPDGIKECFIIMACSPGGTASKLLLWAIKGWAKRRDIMVLSCAYTGKHLAGLTRKWGFVPAAVYCSRQI